MPLNMLGPDIAHATEQVAVCLLAQAGIRPAKCDCEKGEQCFCQYEIDFFEVDADKISIVDAGVERVLVCHSKKGNKNVS